MTDLVVPAVLPRPDRTRVVLQAYKSGMSAEQAASELSKHIGRQTGRYDKRDATRVVNAIYAEPERYDPFVDEVAVYRAYLGEKDVWVNLTHYERDKVVNKIVDNVNRRMLHTSYPELEPVEGMTAWAVAVGERPERMRNLANKRKSRVL